MDGDENEAIDYTEFLAATLDEKITSRKEMMAQAFQVLSETGWRRRCSG